MSAPSDTTPAVERLLIEGYRRMRERLHRRLRAGDAEVAALSQAQRETLRNPATAGPFYWAGFVLVGGR